MTRLRIDPLDAIALGALALLALGAGFRFGWDVALMLVGGLLLIYAVSVAAMRTEE